jgi:hypothetical protein
MFPVSKASDFDPPSVELSLAKDAKALIVERTPAPELVFGTQNRKSIFGFEMSIHCCRQKEPARLLKTHNRDDG